MRRELLIKTLWLTVPLLLAAIAIGVLSLTDIKNAAVVTRVKIEALIIGCAVLVSICWGVLTLFQSYSRRLEHKLTRQLQTSHREEHQRFIRRLDHELKNPLTAIHLGLENLQQSLAETSARNGLEELKIQTRRLTQLTNDLRKLAAFDEQQLELENIDIAELLVETRELVADQHPDRDPQLILPAAPWPVPRILADRDLLQLALYNLLENAIKYSNQDDHIEIRAQDENNQVKIEIADTGLGIPKKDQAKVWEELFRAANSKDRSGTGIGLSLVKRIIERHNGTISLDSKENTGTRITVYLPVSTN